MRILNRKTWPHNVIVTTRLVPSDVDDRRWSRPPEDWCDEYLAYKNWYMTIEHTKHTATGEQQIVRFYFKREQDAVYFALKWL